jgi:hypothetical protein
MGWTRQTNGKLAETTENLYQRGCGVKVLIPTFILKKLPSGY